MRLKSKYLQILKCSFDLVNDQQIHLLHDLVIFHQEWTCCHKGWISN